MEGGDVLQPISLLTPDVQLSLVHHVTGLFHQGQAGGGGVIVSIISTAPAAAAAAAATTPTTVTIASSLSHLLPSSLLHLPDGVQQQHNSRKGCGILARSRDVRPGGFERRKLLEEQHGWKGLLLLSGQPVCQQDAQSRQHDA
jgi:hypothetical protein